MASASAVKVVNPTVSERHQFSMHARAQIIAMRVSALAAEASRLAR